jgi:organic hydroperoxide reductase OsmC/OhrA
LDASERGPSRPTRRLGTNPEQLFAAGWSACFEGAIASVSLRRSSLTYIVTWTFFASTPGVAVPAAGGFPAMSGDVGRSLLKDLVLLAASLCLLLNSLGMTSRRA